MKFNVREFLDKYRDASIPEYIYEECRELSIKNPSCIIEISDNIIDAIEKSREKVIFENKHISMCATLNHEGIAHEKAGEIDLAIRAYEQNIGNQKRA